MTLSCKWLTCSTNVEGFMCVQLSQIVRRARLCNSAMVFIQAYLHANLSHQ